jgi:hypothetical protein
MQSFDKPIKNSKAIVTYDQVNSYLKSYFKNKRFKIIGGLQRRGYSRNDIDFILYQKPPKNSLEADKMLLPIMEHFKKRIDCFFPLKNKTIEILDVFTDTIDIKEADYEIFTYSPQDSLVHLTSGKYTYMANGGHLTKHAMKDAERIIQFKNKRFREMHSLVLKQRKYEKQHGIKSEVLKIEIHKKEQYYYKMEIELKKEINKKYPYNFFATIWDR